MGLSRVRSTARALILAVAVALPFVACGSSSSSSFPGADGGSSGGGDASVDGASCKGSQRLCGATCVDTSSDPANCGSCGNVCEGGTCCGSVCVADTASCAFVVTGVSPTEGNQNGGDWIKITGNGFGPGLAVLLGDGVAPALATDANHAVVLTPPGKVGTVDITIVMSATKSVLPQSFQYQGGNVQLPWTEKPMQFVRGEDPALAVLQDGRVLIAGGTTVPDDPTHALDSAEIYTRSTDSVAPAGGKMSAPRMHDAAITLLDGKVLILGGAAWTDASSGTPAASADLFDPSSGTFAPTAHAMSAARAGIRSVLMADGRVLVTSGADAVAEIYDPAKDAFTQLPLLATHTQGFIARMRDGRILLGAGDGGVATCEIFDPAKGKFVPAGPLNQGRSMLTAHTLPDGRVMVIGGASISSGGIHVPLDSIELYDPATDKWLVAPYKLSVGRTWHASALVRDGTVLVMGGYDIDGQCNPPSNTVDQVDPVNLTVKPFGTLPHPNTEWTAVTLQDGSVLGVGGGACGTPLALPSLDFLPGKPVGQ
jgi:hypothetical protein